MLLTEFVGGNVPYVRVSETRANNTAGTVYTNNAWTTTELNTLDLDTDNIVVSLVSNIITLPAGVYGVRTQTRSVFSSNQSLQPRLRQVNPSASTLIKWPYDHAYNTSSTQTKPPLVHEAQIRLTATAGIQFQHYLRGTSESFTIFNDGENEVYAILEFWKLR